MKWKFRLNPELSGAWSVHNSGDFSKHNSQAELSLSALCNPGFNKTAQSLCVAGNNLVTPVDPSGFASLQLLQRRCISRCTCERCTAFPDALHVVVLRFQMHCCRTAVSCKTRYMLYFICTGLGTYCGT